MTLNWEMSDGADGVKQGMSVTRFIPRKVMEGGKEIGEALEFSDGSIAIRFFIEKDRCHLLNLVPVQELGPESKTSDVPDKVMKKQTEAIMDNVVSRIVAEKYRHCKIYEKALNGIIDELIKCEPSELTRDNVFKIIDSVLFREGKALSRRMGYLCYLTKSNIIFLKRGTKGKKSAYLLNPFYQKKGMKGAAGETKVME